MVISDPTIDPITGLPLLNPSDVVQQIPLGVQAFPWQDMGATALPTRGPLYGDDILPVSAFVAGQHPQTGSAQTVQTDGKHALLVKDVGGGGGGGPAPVVMATQGFGGPLVHGDNTFPSAVNGGFYLYAAVMSYTVIDPGLATTYGTAKIQLQPDVSGNNVDLGLMVPQAGIQGGGFNFFPVSNFLAFPWPLDLRVNPTTSQTFTLVVGNAWTNADFRLILFFSNP